MDRARNEACGDSVSLYLKVGGGRVERAPFGSLGCTAAIAAGSVLTELVQGMAIDDLGTVDGVRIGSALAGLPPMKSHAAALAADALQAPRSGLPGCGCN